MTPLQRKQFAKRSRFSTTRSKTGIGYTHVPKSPHNAATFPMSTPVRVRKARAQEFENLVLTIYIASFIRSLFPTGMMVAATLMLLNVTVLISIQAPEIKGSLAGVSIQLVVVITLFYLLFGAITRLTISKNAKNKCIKEASVVIKACPSTTC